MLATDMSQLDVLVELLLPQLKKINIHPWFVRDPVARGNSGLKPPSPSRAQPSPRAHWIGPES